MNNPQYYTMGEKNNGELYAALVRKAEANTAKGRTLNRFEALTLLDELGVELNRDSVDLIEKLYADGFVKA